MLRADTTQPQPSSLDRKRQKKKFHTAVVSRQKLISPTSIILNVHDTQEIKSLCSVLLRVDRASRT